MSEIKTMMDQARASLIKKRQELTEQMSRLEGELKEIEHEFSAIEAYDRAKQGKATRQTRTTGRRQAIFDLLSKNAMNRRDILTALNAKGDKRSEQSISNTLSALRKAGKIDLINGIYSARVP